MTTLRWQWRRRLHFSDASAVGLAFGAELWNQDADAYESAAAIRDRRSSRGRAVDADSVVDDITLTLLDDVVDAAGGAELAVDRVHATVERAQQRYAEWSARSGELPDGGHLADTTTEEAWYSLEEMLVWARTLDERLRRPARNRRLGDQGLLMALADGPRREAIIAARSKLLQSPAGEARFLAGLNLHMQPMQAGTKYGRIRAGQVVLPFPDPVTDHVLHRWQLSYGQGRDGVAFADAVLDAVATFMDDLLSALETHLPERLRRPD